MLQIMCTHTSRINGHTQTGHTKQYKQSVTINVDIHILGVTEIMQVHKACTHRVLMILYRHIKQHTLSVKPNVKTHTSV